jgi:hypothetical protein
MATTRLPGFTADHAISGSMQPYGPIAALHSPDTTGTVQPALPRICDTLSELVWGAYNEGAYNRGEFWLNVMERAGCFR